MSILDNKKNFNIIIDELKYLRQNITQEISKSNLFNPSNDFQEKFQAVFSKAEISDEIKEKLELKKLNKVLIDIRDDRMMFIDIDKLLEYKDKNNNYNDNMIKGNFLYIIIINENNQIEYKPLNIDSFKKFLNIFINDESIEQLLRDMKYCNEKCKKILNNKEFLEKKFNEFQNLKPPKLEPIELAEEENYDMESYFSDLQSKAIKIIDDFIYKIINELFHIKKIMSAEKKLLEKIKKLVMDVNNKEALGQKFIENPYSYIYHFKVNNIKSIIQEIKKTYKKEDYREICGTLKEITSEKINEEINAN
jgi:hypothetical protein